MKVTPDDEQKPVVPPRPEVLLKMIHFLAGFSDRVIITDHAQDRMEERSITSRMMFDTLAKGRIKGSITPARKAGDWHTKVACKMSGGRDVGVVTVVKEKNRLIILTVEWED